METDEIGEFISKSNFSRLPAPVIERTRLAILNFIGVSIGANGYPQAEPIVKACKSIQDGTLPIFGSGETAGLLGSAWANSALSHLLGFDDTHLESIVHPSAPVISSALSIAMNDRIDGKEVIFASAMGMEISIRLALAVGLDERYSDWHNTSLFGTSASAVTSSILHHLNHDGISSAMLQGLTVATGFLSNKATASKSFQVGRSAAEGIMSSIAASNGVSVSKNILGSFATSLSEKHDLSILTNRLGQNWEVLKNYLKPYPCGVVLHPGIDAAVEARNRGIDRSEIEEVHVHVNPIVMVLTSFLEPRTGMEGKYSATHSIACALLNGPLYPEHFSNSAVTDPLTLELRKKIRMHESEDINRGQTRLEILLKNGKKEIVEVNRGPETPSKHLDTEDVRRKFHHLADHVIGKDKAGEIWDYFSRVDSKSDLSEAIEVFS